MVTVVRHYNNNVFVEVFFVFCKVNGSGKCCAAADSAKNSFGFT